MQLPRMEEHLSLSHFLTLSLSHLFSLHPCGAEDGPTPPPISLAHLPIGRFCLSISSVEVMVLEQIREKGDVLAIGLMSGTSADGIDVALVKVHGAGLDTQLELQAFDVLRFSPAVRQRLLTAMGPKGAGNMEFCLLSSYLGELFAHACHHIVKKANVAMEDVDIIGLHGQTLYHHPKRENMPGFAVTGTIQAGSAAVVAERTGRLVVSDFRSRDMAAGGQGAPLVPYLDYILYRHRSRGRVAVNIGGIANVTAIPADSELDAIMAFDTGPGNCLIDMAVSRLTNGTLAYDAGGKMALAGKVNPPLLDALLKHPFFAQAPPKSADKAAFGEEFLGHALAEHPGLHPNDIVATLTALTVRTIHSALMEHVLQRTRYEEMILSGGGALNPVLVSGLQQAMPKLFITRSDDYSIPSKAKEAVMMAFLAHETVMGLAGNVPSATGAARRVILGSITPGALPA